MRILGIDFFEGEVAGAVDTMCKNGGLLVAPSGTCFGRLQRDPDYRQAVTSADLVLADSGLMVTLWRILRGPRITRISGLAYLQRLVKEPAVWNSGATFWVLPNDVAQKKAIAWAATQGFRIDPDNCYVAPFYGRVVADETAAALVEELRPRHVVIGLGAGAQEKLGYYLREHLKHRPAIHCIGGALGFVTGDQVRIPDWADRLYLGWLFRLVSNPRRFLPRAANALALPHLILKYGESLPPLKTLKR